MSFNPQFLNLMMEYIYIDIDKSYKQEILGFISRNQNVNNFSAMSYGFGFDGEAYYFSSQYEHLGVMPLSVDLAPEFRTFLIKWGNIENEKKKINAFLRRVLVLAKTTHEMFYLLPKDLAAHLNRYNTLDMDSITKETIPRLDRFKKENANFYTEIQERLLKNLILKDTKDKSIT